LDRFQGDGKVTAAEALNLLFALFLAGVGLGLLGAVLT
jgi:hypothetical protein